MVSAYHRLCPAMASETIEEPHSTQQYESASTSLDGSTSPTRGITVDNIIAVMAVDPEGKDKGETLRRWYIKRGFQKGRISKIGFKRGHWFVPYDEILTPCHSDRPPGSILFICNMLFRRLLVFDIPISNTHDLLYSNPAHGLDSVLEASTIIAALCSSSRAR